MSNHTCSDDACTCFESGEREAPPPRAAPNGSRPPEDVWFNLYANRATLARRSTRASAEEAFGALAAAVSLVREPPVEPAGGNGAPQPAPRRR